MILSLVIFVIQRINGIIAFSGVAITAIIVFGIIGATAGFYAKRN